jgi:iron only hydrogenase large subunit-like protein
MPLIVLNPTKGEGQRVHCGAAVLLSCEDEVVNWQKNKETYSHNEDPEDIMNVRQNAQVIVNAERYYRAMITAGQILEYSGPSYGSYF